MARITGATSGLKYIYVQNQTIKYPVYPSGITTDGTKIWFAGNDPFQLNGGLWSMKADGTMVAYPIAYSPAALTTGSDGNVWFTSNFGGQPSQIVKAIIK